MRLRDMISLSPSSLSLSWGWEDRALQFWKCVGCVLRVYVTGLISMVSQEGNWAAPRPNSCFPLGAHSGFGFQKTLLVRYFITRLNPCPDETHIELIHNRYVIET